jgi:putative membrane protein
LRLQFILLTTRVVTPRWSWLYTRWDWEPSILIGLAALGIAYWLLISGRLTSPSGNPKVAHATTSQVAAFVASEVILALALLSPIDSFGDEYLFSAHMIQHLLLASVWPPLLLLGIPRLYVQRFGKLRLTGRMLVPLPLAIAVLLLFNVDMSIWHIPWLYDLTLQNENVHLLEHLSFMGLGLLSWIPILSPISSLRLTYPLQALYLFVGMFPTMGLGIFFTFLNEALYSPYVAAPRVWGISPVTDQQLGGLIMWLPGMVPYISGLLAVFFAWFEGGKPSMEMSTEEFFPGELFANVTMRGNDVS